MILSLITMPVKFQNTHEISDTHIHIDKRGFYKYLNAFVSYYNAII